MNEPMRELQAAVYDGRDEDARALTESLLAKGTPPMDIITEAIRPSLERVGDMLATGKLFIPDLVLAGEAARVSMDLLTPELAKGASRSPLGKVVMGVVEGDTHDIGKNLVKAMLIAAGFDIVDLDTNVSPAKFIQAIEAEHPDILAASAYTSATAVEISKLSEALRQAGVRSDVKLLIGGAGVYRDDVARFEADDFGYDAVEAVEVAKRFTKEKAQVPA